MDWLKYARSNAVFFNLMTSNTENEVLKIVLFGAQQAVEKWLKALALNKGLTIKKTTNLVKLNSNLVKLVPELNNEKLIERLQILTAYSVANLYPGRGVDNEIFLKHISMAKTLLPEFEALIKPHFPEQVWC